VDRLQATIDTLLAVARDEPRGHATSDLTQLLDAVERHWHGPLAADGRPLELRLPAGARVEAAAAPEVVREVLDVLLGNAHAHGQGRVTLTVSEVEGWPAVDVADEGPGFATDPEQAFARRSGEAREHGIGLSLARALATAEGGRLLVIAPGPHPTVRLILRPVRAERARPAP
jgi:signal transduction histidine kinase